MSTSCSGCQWMYFQDTGYSNYTVMDTYVDCMLEKNPNFPADMPWDWNMEPEKDNWPATNSSRCEEYLAGESYHLDVDGDEIEELRKVPESERDEVLIKLLEIY